MYRFNNKESKRRFKLILNFRVNVLLFPTDKNNFDKKEQKSHLKIRKPFSDLNFNLNQNEQKKPFTKVWNTPKISSSFENKDDQQNDPQQNFPILTQTKLFDTSDTQDEEKEIHQQSMSKIIIPFLFIIFTLTLFVVYNLYSTLF